MRARVAAVAGLAAVLSLSVGVASASTLDVQGGRLTAMTSQACSAGPIHVDETGGLLAILFGYSGVSLTVPAACAGTDLHVTIYATSGGAVQATASAAAVSAGTVSLTTSASYGGLLSGRPAYSVALTFNGWSVPASF